MRIKRKYAAGRFENAAVSACVIAAAFAAGSSVAKACTPIPNTLTNGTTADASQVMGNFNDGMGNGIQACPLFTGNVGVGTTSPSAALDVYNGWITPQDNVATDTGANAGITWFTPSPNLYGIFRTAGPWTSPNYEQLEISFNTGVIIDGGSAYGHSGTVLQPNGGNVGIGMTTPPALLSLYGPVDSTAGPNMIVEANSDSYPLFELLNWSHDNVSLNFDSFYDGSQYLSGSNLNNYQIVKTGGVLQFNYAAGVTAGAHINWTAGMLLNSSGWIGIGAPPSSPLTVTGSNAGGAGDTAAFSSNLGSSSTVGNQVNITNYAGAWGLLAGFDGSGVSASLYHGPNTGYLVSVVGPLNLGANNSVNLTIASDGGVGIGTTTPTHALEVNGTTYSTTGWGTTSDGRLKKDVTTIPDALGIVERLRGVEFRWLPPQDRSVGKGLALPLDQQQVGFVAQEVQKVVPEAVAAPAAGAGSTYSVDPGKIVAILVEAVKEQQLEIAAQKAEIAKLEAAIGKQSDIDDAAK